MSSRKTLTLYLAGLLLLVAAGGGVALLAHSRNSRERHEGEQRRSEVAAGPLVLVAPVRAAAAERRLDLQAEARPFAEVTLYAKISGYLKVINVDKGDFVRKDQLLAIIISPELDRQYDAAVADAQFKRKNAGRTSSLASAGFVSPRDAELDNSQALIADATAAGLGTQKSYTQLRAPFDGTITARYVDPGALLQSAANSQTSALPVVTVSQLDRLRIYAYVNQRDAALVHLNDPVEIRVPDGPMTTGQVSRLPGALDVRTRMMLVEVDLDNRDRRIVPGSFVNVALTLKLEPAQEIPVEALVVRGKQTLVAAVGPDRRVHFRPVAVQSNNGAQVRIKSSLKEGEEVALNLGDRVAEGAPVQPASAGVAAPAGAAR